LFKKGDPLVLDNYRPISLLNVDLKLLSYVLAHKEINRDQNDTVVNLSSKDLKPAEIRILSKGLNFCPTPNKINEEQLSADLDKFARSLRIKEYFSAKEKDCPVDGSSDSEDDNEIPLPRYKKKSSWIPKPSKIQL
jgi:hypothetical protein